MKELTHGTIFAVPLPDGSFLCGRVLLDIYGCLKRRLFPADSPLPGLGKPYLIEMYSADVPLPGYVDSPLLIPGAYIESREVGANWPIIGHKRVDPTTIEFPESLIGFMHPGGEVAFECGEIGVPISLSLYDLQNRIAEYRSCHSAYLWPFTCLRTMGRDREVPEGYKMASLSGSDLRFSQFRQEVFQLLPFAMEESYFQKQAQLRLHLERLYE